MQPMEGPRLPVDLQKKATETFEFERMLGATPDSALINAVTAALESYKRQVMDELADLAERYADDLDVEAAGEEDIYEGSLDTAAGEYSHGLRWFADKVRNELPVDGDYDYEPTDGDLVELIIRGQVYNTGGSTWRVYAEQIIGMDGSGIILDRKDPGDTRVRLLNREG
jgi:hypothetical protein